MLLQLAHEFPLTVRRIDQFVGRHLQLVPKLYSLYLQRQGDLELVDEDVLDKHQWRPYEGQEKRLLGGLSCLLKGLAEGPAKPDKSHKEVLPYVDDDPLDLEEHVANEQDVGVHTAQLQNEVCLVRQRKHGNVGHGVPDCQFFEE